MVNAVTTFCSLLIVYVAVWNLQRVRYTPKLYKFMGSKGYRLVAYRPFISVYDGVVPPFYTWVWRIFRVTVETASGEKKCGWVRCDNTIAEVEWDGGTSEKMDL